MLKLNKHEEKDLLRTNRVLEILDLIDPNLSEYACMEGAYYT